MGIIINGQNDTIGPVDNSMSLLGTVSIGGTMTIEDFTNIDSVGIITARNGLQVTGGNVGINEASPDSKFHVNSGAETVPARFESTGTQSRIGFKASGTPSSYHVACGAEANDFIVYTNNTEKLRVDSVGRLLIGRISTLQSSAERLTIDSGMAMFRRSSTNAAALYIRNEDFTADTRHPYLIFTDGSGNRGGFGIQNDQSSLWISGQNGIAFRTSGSAPSQEERLRITSDGQMILGTASNLGSVPPKLTIVNNTNSSTFSECQLLRLNGPSGVGERGGIGFHYAQSLDYGEKPSSFIGVETVAAGGAQQTDLLFATRPNTTDSEPTERLRINSAGNLGVNKTPEDDWSGSYRAIEIGNSGVSAYQGSTYPSIELNMNCRGTAASYSAGWKYILGMRATQIHMPYDGKVLFRRAASGSADGDITWNESMRITEDGKTGIGGINPQNLLNVNATGSMGLYGTTTGKAGHSIRFIRKYGSSATHNFAVINGASPHGQSRLGGFVATYTFRSAYGFDSDGGGHGVRMLSGRVRDSGEWGFDTETNYGTGDSPRPTLQGVDNNDGTCTLQVVNPGSTHSYGEFHIVAWDCQITTPTT